MKRLFAMLALVTLSCNCAAQRHSMVKVTFMDDGKPYPEMACVFSDGKDGLEASCISIQELARRLARDEAAAQERENRWKL